MAQRTIVQLIDDLDGGEAEETVLFSLDGVEYTIDLSPGNAERLRRGLADFIEKARKPYGSRRRAPGRAPRPPRADRSGLPKGRIRDWAREQGHNVSDRGRIPEMIYSQYFAAHPDEKSLSGNICTAGSTAY